MVIECLQKGCWTCSARDFQFVLKGVQELASMLFFPSSFCQEPNSKIIKEKRSFWRRWRESGEVSGWATVMLAVVAHSSSMSLSLVSSGFGAASSPDCPMLPIVTQRPCGWRLLKAHTCSCLSKRQQCQTCCQLTDLCVELASFYNSHLKEREEGILVKVFPRLKHGSLQNIPEARFVLAL